MSALNTHLHTLPDHGPDKAAGSCGAPVRTLRTPRTAWPRPFSHSSPAKLLSLTVTEQPLGSSQPLPPRAMPRPLSTGQRSGPKSVSSFPNNQGVTLEYQGPAPSSSTEISSPCGDTHSTSDPVAQVQASPRCGSKSHAHRSAPESTELSQHHQLSHLCHAQARLNTATLQTHISLYKIAVEISMVTSSKVSENRNHFLMAKRASVPKSKALSKKYPLSAPRAPVGPEELGSFISVTALYVLRTLVPMVRWVSFHPK